MLNEFGEETTGVLTDRQIGSMPTLDIEGDDSPKTAGSFMSTATHEAQAKVLDLAAMRKADDENEEAFAGMPTEDIRKRLEYARLEARARMMTANPSQFQDEEMGSIFRELNRRRFIADDRDLAAFDVLDADGKVTNLSRLQDFLAFSDRLAKAKDANDAQSMLEDKFMSPTLKAWREAQANGTQVEYARRKLEEEGRDWGDKVAGLREMLPSPNDILEKTVGNVGVPEDRRNNEPLVGEYLSDRRAVEEYERRLLGEKMRLEAAKVMPFLNEAQRNLVNIYAAGGEVGQGVFKAMLPKDREMMYSMIQAVRPDWEGNWLTEMAVRAGMGVRAAWRGARRADIGATDFLLNKGGEYLFGRTNLYSTPEEREEIRKGMLDDIHWAEAVHDLKLKDPEGFIAKALEGYADSASLQYSMLGGVMAKRAGAALKGTWGGVALQAGGAILEGYAAASMIGEQFDNMLKHGVDIQMAGALAVPGGLVDAWVEEWNLKDWFGRDLAPAEMKRVGLRAAFRAALKLDGRAFIRVCRTNFKQAVKIAGSEVREELIQGANQAGWCSLAEGNNVMDAFMSSDTYKAGMQAFWDALPSCTAFGVFGAANPTGTVARQANSAYAERLGAISGEVAKRMGIDNLDKAGAEAAYRATLNEAARIVEATKGMSVRERNAWINAQEDLSLAEKQFFAEHVDMYQASVAQDGEAWANAHLTGSINEAMFVKAGWKFEHDENGNVVGVTTAQGKSFKVNLVNRLAEVGDFDDKRLADFIAEYNRINPDKPLTGKDDPRLAEAVKLANGWYSDGTVTLFGGRATNKTLGHEVTHGLIDLLSKVNDKAARQSLKAIAQLMGGKVDGGKIDVGSDEGAAETVEDITGAVSLANEMIAPDGIDVKALGKNLVTAVRKAVGLGKGRVFLPVIRSGETVGANPEEYLHDLVARGFAALARRDELEKARKEELAKVKAEREAKRQKKIAARKEAAEKAKGEARRNWVLADEEAKKIEDEIAAEEKAETDAINAKYEAEFSIGDRSAENVAKFYLAREIMENRGLLPDASRAAAVARSLNYHGSVSDLMAKAQAEAASQTQLLRYLASDPKTEKVLARAGLALRNERAIERARAAAIQFSREVSEAANGTRKATERAVRMMRGEDYDQMMMREGLDLNAILKAIVPPERAEKSSSGTSASADTTPPKLDDAARAIVAEAAKKAVARGAEDIAKARKMIEKKRDEAKGDDKSGKPASADNDANDPDIAYGNAIADAIRNAIAKAGFTLDSPEAMVQLVKAVTEKYIRDFPAEFGDLDPEDVWSSPLARARFAANLASFAQSVAEAYAPSYARIRIAERAQLLNDKGLTTMRRIEEAGEALFRDLHKDIIRQSRESLVRDIRKLVKPHAQHYRENELTQERKGVDSALGRYCKFAYRVMNYSAKECEERAKVLEQELAGWVGVADAEKNRIREFADKKTELEMIDMFGNLMDRMPAELEAIRDFVEQTINESRWDVMQYGEKWEQARTQAAESVKGGIVGNPKRGGVKPEDGDVSGLYSLIGMFETKARQLTRWATGADRDASLKAFSAVEEMIQRAEDIQYNYAQQEKAKFVDLCRTCYGDESGAAKALSAEIDKAEWKNLDRGDQHTVWTIGRVMQMYVSCVQADYADNCAKWGRDAAYVRHLEDIINAMNPKHMEFIKGLRQIYAEQGAALSDVMERTTGTMMLTPNRNYMPVKMFRNDNLGQKGRARAYNPFAPSLTPRVRNGLDFRQDVDIIDLWEERMTDAAHTIAWADTGSMVQGILQSDRVLRAIRDAHGDKVLGQWQRYVLDILAGAETGKVDSGNWGVAAMRFCARLASRTWLMLNPASWAKQLSSVPCFALSGDGNLRSVAKSVAFCALHPFEAAKVMKDLSETSAFKARYGVAISQEMKYATSDRSRFDTWVSRQIDRGMSGVAFFDKLGVYTLAGVYQNRRAELETQGKSKEEASELAASWLMHIVDKTAQTSRSLNTTELQRAGGAWGILLQFKSAPAQQTQFELEAVQDALAHPEDGARWKRAAKIVLINHVIVPTITTAIESLMSCLTSWGLPDDEKRKRLIEMWISNIVSGSLGSILFLGTVAEGFASIVGKIATNQGVNAYDLRNAMGRQIPAAEMLNLWINNGDKAIRAFAELTDGDIQEGVEELAFAIGAVTPGLSWASRKAHQALKSAREK